MAWPINRVSFAGEEDWDLQLGRRMNRVVPENSSSNAADGQDDDDPDLPLSVSILGSLIIYEWEEELDEYDEPDIYPSEKDYKWFEEQVTDSEDEEGGKGETAETSAVETGEVKEPSEVAVVDGAEQKPVGGSEQAQKEKTEGDAEDEGDEFVPTVAVEEEEVEEAPKKKYKTVMVKKLVERPPKIYHLAAKLRVEDHTDNEDYFPVKPIEFLYSFGYDCQRLGNLIVLDKTTLLFMSGFVLTFYNHNTFTKTHLRSLGGGSFGSITLHPSRKLFAAAEKGKKPVIGIWSWPKLQLFRKLEDGTDKIYASVTFSPDGKLLASQGGEPDYLITVWNWLAEAPILRVKSHVQDVFRVTFARELAGLLTTSGLCHIKFWKMARTFTGLKLKGDVGRFGKTELTDIEGYVEMPDGKVLSGTEWGNLLVWENGLVIAELCMAMTTPCHHGVVREISMVEGDFFTTGQDGRIKVWRFDDVDTAEIYVGKDSLKVPIKPISDVVIDEEADIWSIFRDPYNNDDISVFWFAQDGMGRIWKVDLSFLNIAKEPSIVLTANGGPILSGATSPFGNMIALIGGKGKIIIHDYITKQMVAMRGFSAPGSCLVWPNQNIANTGCMLFAGFSDGVLRILTLLRRSETNQLPIAICLHRVYKPHRRSITSIAFDYEGEYLVTGSEDGTVFFFNAADNFAPMVFVEINDWLPVQKVMWSSLRNKAQQKIVIVICQGAFIQEIELPLAFDNTASYHFTDVNFLRSCRVKSIKSVLRHNEELDKKQQAWDEKMAQQDRENARLLDNEIETQDEQNARLLSEAEEQEKIRIEEARIEKKWKPYIPPVPNSILDAVQDIFDYDVFYVTLGGFDAGYVYSIRLVDDHNKDSASVKRDEPFNAVPVEDLEDVPVHRFVFINDGTKLLLGFQDGRVRLVHLEHPYDLESIQAHWTTGLHDVIRGSITSIALDKDERFLFTTGMDGNCFMHSFVDHSGESTSTDFEVPVGQSPIEVHDIREQDAFTLEDSKNVEKEKAILAAARRNKASKREKIARLRIHFTEILNRNNELPPEIRLTPVELSLASDSAVRNEERRKQALDQLHRELAWTCEYQNVALKKLKSFFVDRVENQRFIVKAFKSGDQVSSFRLAKFPHFFESAKRMGHVASHKPSYCETIEDECREKSETFVFVEPRPKRKPGMDKFVHQKLVRLWERRLKKIKRNVEWGDFLNTDPADQELEEELKLIEDARMNMGDMKLKLDPKYKVPDELRLTVNSARQKLIFLEEKMFSLQETFNKQLLSLRNNKVKVFEKMRDLREKIIDLQNDLPKSKLLLIPQIVPMTIKEDPNALMTVTREEVVAFQKKMETVKTRLGGSRVSGKGEANKLYKVVDQTKRQRRSLTKTNDEQTPVEQDIGSFVEHVVCEPSELELQIQQRRLVESEFYQKYYIECIDKEMFTFDARLKLLKHKKIKLDYELKVADAKMIILTEEFILSKKSVDMEARLENSVKDSTKEKRTCTTSMKSLQKNVDTLKKELELVATKKVSLLKEVQEIASATPQYEKYLIRVFRKKINLALRRQASADGELGDEQQSEESEESDDSDVDLAEDDESDDGLDVDLPPSDLKSEIYEAVVEVRTRRVRLDEAETKARAVLDDLNLQIVTFKQRINAADKDLNQTQQDLDKFNLEKQNKLNSIEDTACLKLHQIKYMHSHLDDALVTDRSCIKRLRDRIPEMKRERRREKTKVVTTRKQFYRLGHEDRKFKQRLADMDKRCDQEMLLKFGRVWPLEELVDFSEDPEITRLKKEIADMETKFQATMMSLERDIRAATRIETSLDVAETNKLVMLCDMKVELHDINKAMDEGLKVLPQDIEDNRGEQEIKRMRKIIKAQSSNIDALKAQVMILTNGIIKPLPPIKPSE